MKNYFAKLKERDENAIKKLYDDYVRLIYHIAYSYTKNKEDSEDITSEVFLKIVKSIDNYTDSEEMVNNNKLFTEEDYKYLYETAKHNYVMKQTELD